METGRADLGILEGDGDSGGPSGASVLKLNSTRFFGDGVSASSSEPSSRGAPKIMLEVKSGAATWVPEAILAGSREKRGW